MKSATPTTKSKKSDNRRYCASKTCRKQFRTNDKRQKYCSESCRTNRNNSKRRVDPIEKAKGSKVFYWIAKECIRAGTYEILVGHDEESLGELYEVYTLAHRANQYSNVEDYEISHICPVKGGSKVGLLHSQNLVVSEMARNRSHGTKHFGEGKWIDRSSLKDFLKVNPDDKESEVKEKVIRFLGRPLVEAFVKTHKIDIASSIKDRNWINQNADLDIPEHLEIYELAQQAKGKEVSNLRRELKALIDDAPIKPGFNLNVSSMSVFRVLAREWKRHATFRPEIAVHFEQFKEATEGRYVVLADNHTQLIFDLLHGKSIDELEIQLETMIAELTLRTVVNEIAWWDDVFGDIPDQEVNALRQYSEYADRVQEQADALAARKKRVSKKVVEQVVKQAEPFKLNITQPEILTRDLDELAHRRSEERRLAAVVSLPAVPVQAPSKSLTDSFLDDLEAEIGMDCSTPVHVPVFALGEDDDDDEYDPFAFVEIKRVA